MTTRKLVYPEPAAEAVTVRRDVAYQETDAGALTADLYYPAEAQKGSRLPAVVFVMGYSDLGAQAFFGCRFKEMESFIAWARLAAASGVVGITYATGKDPAADVQTLLRYVRQNAGELGIDEDRIGVWACSGHVPNALSVLMQEGNDFLKCAVLCYGLMLDLEGSTSVAEAAATYRFVNPATGRRVEELPRNLPLFIVRDGQDEFEHLNETMDRFLAKALSLNLPVSFVNHSQAPHAFDLMHDSETSREIIRQILAFLRFHLAPC